MINMTISVFHADHEVSTATIEWAVSHINPQGFFLRTLELPEGHADLMNALWGPVCGDPSMEGESYIKVRDPNDKWRPETPFVKRAARPTRLLTIIGVAEGEDVKVFTAYGGPAAHRVPGDPSLVPGTAEHAEAVAFWKTHALIER